MLEISQSIRNLEKRDIADNILHYDYNTKHLLSLVDKGLDAEDPSFMSSYRSFEGEVFENFIYEKLLRYAEDNEYIAKFILKGFHQNKCKAFPNTLSISEKEQIVYRTKSREISEFDAMFVTKENELYFVEMTLVIFDPEAQAEFLAAVQYYEDCQHVLGRRFHLVVESAIQKIAETP